MGALFQMTVSFLLLKEMYFLVKDFMSTCAHSLKNSKNAKSVCDINRVLSMLL